MNRLESVMSLTQPLCLALALLAWTGPNTAMAAPPPGPALPVNCSGDYRVDKTLSNGARWTLCWEPRFLEGVVLRDVVYTAPQGEPVLVLSRANPAQIHVPYDDNGARFHDVSDYGLGGPHLARLDSADCPEGELRSNGERPVVCLKVVNRGYVTKYYTTALQGEALRLYSVSHVGEYNYIYDYGFYDDGSIEFAVGASGKLQIYTRNAEKGEKYGWPLGALQYGVSHVHNYYWRLDFDLAGVDDDQVEELAFPPEDETRETRIKVQTAFTEEAARTVEPENFRSWRIKDTRLTNADGHSISYHLEADPAHRFLGPDYEPFTESEVYITRYRLCERFASHNPSWNGCAEDAPGFVNGESLEGEDLVLWYGQAFHHLPSDEDEPKMHTHWSRFYVRPRDLNSESPLTSSAAASQEAHPHSHAH